MTVVDALRRKVMTVIAVTEGGITRRLDGAGNILMKDVVLQVLLTRYFDVTTYGDLV